MNLRSKMFVGVFGSLFILLPIIYFIIAERIERGFSEIEDDFIQANTHRVEDALNELVQKLSEKQADWAAWDDTYEYINDHNKAFEESNLNDETFTDSLKINLMYFINLKGDVVFKKMVDDETGKEISVPPEFEKLILRDSPLMQHTSPDSQAGGLILGQSGRAYIVSSRPIVKSSVEGPIRGTLVWGYHLKPTILARLSQITHLKFQFQNLDEVDLNEAPSTHRSVKIVKNSGSNVICGIIRVRDLYGLPRFLLQVETDRKIYHQGQMAIRSVLYVLVVAILVTGFILTVFLRKEILNPLSRVSANLNAISLQKDPSKRVQEGSSDEIGELIRHINEVLTALEEINAKYIQAQKMEAIGILAGGMAHDFNNILGGIMGYASLLKQKLGGDEKVLRQLNVILSSAERGAQITRELLGFARRGKYEKQAVNINESIESTVSMLDATIGKDVEINLSLFPNLSMIEGDSNQIFQVLLNLSVNARDAMPDGGKITITTDNISFDAANKELGLPKGNYVRIIFADTGNGIPPEAKDKIFEPFFTTKPSNKGTGLGLSMIYGIMQNHGGSIVLGKTSAAGSEFHLHFPASTMPAEAKPAVIQDQLGESLFSSKITNKKILLADDEVALRDALKDTLEAAGNQVFCAENGKEAVALFRKHKNEIDVIILDLIMPEMDGVAAYKIIRQFLTKKIPVIFSSGYTASSQIAAIRKTDGVMFIQKPFCPDEIFNLLALNRVPPV